jgi:DNA-binding NarL/FixJ family response regulator
MPSRRHPTEVATPTVSFYEARIAGLQLAIIPLESDLSDAESRLTKAQREVLELALQGLSDRAIARARGTSARTVANQLRAVFRALGVSNRLELAAKIR